MLQNRLLVLFLFLSLFVNAQKNTKIGELKGIDFKFGFTMYGLSEEDAIKIYSAIVTPDLERNNIPVTGYSEGYAANIGNTFYLGLASKNKWFTKSKVLKNSENRFGISYSNYSKLDGAITCNVSSPQKTDPELIDGIIKHDSYGVNADYTLNSKPFFKNFAAYASLGASVILHNYKVIKRIDFLKREDPRLNTYSNILLINKNSSFSSLDLKLFLGLKYNWTCEYNLFLECAFGGSYYPAGLSKKDKILPISQLTVLGVRYKFNANPDEKRKEKSSAFW